MEMDIDAEEDSTGLLRCMLLLGTEIVWFACVFLAFNSTLSCGAPFSVLYAACHLFYVLFGRILDRQVGEMTAWKKK